jgi:hypothetical protein
VLRKKGALTLIPVDELGPHDLAGQPIQPESRLRGSALREKATALRGMASGFRQSIAAKLIELAEEFEQRADEIEARESKRD